MMLHRTPRGQSGFSLIETLAALTLFTIVTLGVTPVMISSLRGASLSRSYTKGKNLAVQAMERIRGLPYFVSVGSITPATEPRVDVLDLYFPDMTPDGSSGYQSGTTSFITTCNSSADSPAASGALACPQQVPAGHTVKFEATFVTPSGSGMSTVIPSGYNWNSTTTETAPSPLLKMVVEVSWTQNGATRRTSLTTLLAQRDLAEDETSGSAQIDYLVQGLTGYLDSSGRPSNLVSLIGSSESRIDSRTVTSADQTVEAGRLTLTREEVGSDPAVTLADEFGATDSLHAPPNSNPAPDVVGNPIAVTHPDLGLPVAALGLSMVDDPGVEVVNDLPAATGGFSFDTSLGPDYEVFNDPGLQGADQLHLVAGPMLSAERVGLSELSGDTSAYATALTPTASRKVETTATAQIAKLRMLPAAFVTHTDASVIVITDFSASLSCRATASVATSSATGSWSATLWYWTDLVPNDGIAAGQYVSVPLSGAVGSAATDPLAELKASSNPLVFDHFDSAKDVYLFDDGNVAGYITDWSSRPLIQSSIDATGRKATVDLDGAIQIASTAVNPAVPRSKVTASVGAMSCEAVDKRGL
jgi:prepilin-type N-terminal cleavage/methylation domain-containing protein